MNEFLIAAAFIALSLFTAYKIGAFLGKNNKEAKKMIREKNK